MPIPSNLVPTANGHYTNGVTPNGQRARGRDLGFPAGAERMHEGGRFDREAAMRAVEALIDACGLDRNAEGLRETPRRVADMYQEIFSGLQYDPAGELVVGFDEDHEEMVLVRDIPFYSLCEHHFVPFFGRAHVAYLPNGRVVGLSKIARLVEGFARRPSLQERLTAQIADTLASALDPKGVAVVVEAEHLCMSMRGVQKPGSMTVTSAMRGLYRESAATRSEFLSLLGRSGRA